ncbi:hypothetical protein TRFO_25440 [Tritrichomonas foetus]|uniref:Uncharacterized protein n=1 Tax=Tritrichomonas foetus TaxID=1144522 RepID=A0A1J4K5V9_9EUKA|nr:hypothetical protein TRFO_25440 [Tritrichomonas foetus]|eukprot:OHT06547.1 hypothetical protein TRFO_25440 [Tritrichomonas foetus]
MTQTLNQLTNQVDLLIKEGNKSVSEIYNELVRPFCRNGGDFNEFVTPLEILQQFPAGIVKIRRYFLQILLLFDIYSIENCPDPLSNPKIDQILFLFRSIAPLAIAISNEILPAMFEELNAVHGEKYSGTIYQIMNSLGLIEKDPGFVEQENVQRRVHYEDGKAVKTGLEIQPNKTLLNNHPIFQGESGSNRKKPKHGPDSQAKPLFHV